MNEIIVHGSLTQAVNRTNDIRGGALIPSDDLRLVKVPEVVYQIFYDIAQQGDSLEVRQRKIFKALTEWCKDKYPDHGIISFHDFDRREAEAMNYKLQERGVSVRITWGMYVFIGEGAVTDMNTDIAGVLGNSQVKLSRY